MIAQNDTESAASTANSEDTNTGRQTSKSIVPTTARKIRRGTKLHRVLSGLIQRSYNRFEAERLLHDHTLHSTVSNLQVYGIRVDRCWETVCGYQGASTSVCRYWISEDQRALANALLGNPDDGKSKSGEVT